jgi:hypothetical protein
MMIQTQNQTAMSLDKLIFRFLQERGSDFHGQTVPLADFDAQMGEWARNSQVCPVGFMEKVSLKRLGNILVSKFGAEMDRPTAAIGPSVQFPCLSPPPASPL